MEDVIHKNIARFVTVDDCLRYVLTEDPCSSSFFMGSTTYYRGLEDVDRTNGIGDRKENFVDGSSKRCRSTISTNEALISSWAVIGGELPVRAEWDYWREKERTVAIVSTIQKVSDFLGALPLVHELFKGKILLKLGNQSVEHGTVRYEKLDEDGEKHKAFFYKSQEYIRQNEYRFALRFNPISKSNIHMLTFGVKPIDYIEKIIVHNGDQKTVDRILSRACLHNVKARRIS